MSAIVKREVAKYSLSANSSFSFSELLLYIVMLSFLSGMRAVEIANLRVSNVLSEQNEVLDLIILKKAGIL